MVEAAAAGTSVFIAPPKSASIDTVSSSLLLIDKLFNSACPVPESTVTESNDRQERIFAGGMVPDPVCTHVEPLSNFIRRQKGLLFQLCIQK
jgi:hypothetical protein